MQFEYNIICALYFINWTTLISISVNEVYMRHQLFLNTFMLVSWVFYQKYLFKHSYSKKKEKNIFGFQSAICINEVMNLSVQNAMNVHTHRHASMHTDTACMTLSWMHKFPDLWTPLPMKCALSKQMHMNMHYFPWFH